MSFNFAQELKEKDNKIKKEDKKILNILSNEKDGTEFLVENVWKLYVVPTMKQAVLKHRIRKITFKPFSILQNSKFRHIWNYLPYIHWDYIKLMSEGIVKKAISENLKADTYEDKYYPEGNASPYNIRYISISLE